MINFFLLTIKKKNIALYEQFQNITESRRNICKINTPTHITTDHVPGFVQALQWTVAGLDYIDLKQVSSLI